VALAPAPTAPALKVLFNLGSFQKITQTFSMHIYYNICYKESEEKRMSDLMIMLPFTSFKIFDLLYSRVGAGAASKFSPGAGVA
jgi:hypothetical protein